MSDALPAGFVPDPVTPDAVLPPGFVPDEDPKMAALRAKHDATMAKVAQLKAEPDPFSPGQVVKAVGQNFYDRGAAIARGIKAIAGHPIATFTQPERRRELERGVDDAVTLGYGRRLADTVSRDVVGSQDPTFAETEQADRQVAPDVRAGGAALGAFLPSPVSKAVGAAGKAIASVAKPAASVAGSAARGALAAGGTYTLAAPAIAAAHADSSGHRLESAREAALAPGGLLLSTVLGGGVGALGQVIRAAPARAEESELAGLTEGVQNKTRVQKYAANETEIRHELAQAPELRAAIKQDPVQAAPQVAAKLSEVAEGELEPFYQRMEAAGVDKVPAETAINALKAVRGGLNRVAEKGQIAVLDGAMEDLAQVAQENGGTIPARFLRETATSFQSQGNANTNMFGPVPLTKALKQGIGNALRGAVADHLESLPDSTPAGQALKAAFTSANKRVSTWYRIKDIVDEKATRIQANASPMADMVKEGLHAVRHPVMTLLRGAPAAADSLDRRLLGPLVRSDVGDALGPIGAGVEAGAPRMNLSIDPTMQALERARRMKEAQQQ